MAATIAFRSCEQRIANDKGEDRDHHASLANCCQRSEDGQTEESLLGSFFSHQKYTLYKGSTEITMIEGSEDRLRHALTDMAVIDRYQVIFIIQSASSCGDTSVSGHLSVASDEKNQSSYHDDDTRHKTPRVSAQPLARPLPHDEVHYSANPILFVISVGS